MMPKRCTRCGEEWYNIERLCPPCGRKQGASMEITKTNLGRSATDKISGFSGTVTGRCEYITGCTTFLVQPRVKPDGDFIDSRWVDEDRLEFGDVSVTLEKKLPGGDKPAPRK